MNYSKFYLKIPQLSLVTWLFDTIIKLSRIILSNLSHCVYVLYLQLHTATALYVQTSGYQTLFLCSMSFAVISHNWRWPIPPRSARGGARASLRHLQAGESIQLTIPAPFRRKTRAFATGATRKAIYCTPAWVRPS